MRKSIIIGACIAALACAGAQAQSLNLTVDNREPVTHLDSATWGGMMRRFIDARGLIGKPEVYVVNATPNEMWLKCDKWTLVGNQPYIKTNPTSLRPWTVTLISAEGFDGYCKNGVTGLSSNGEIFQGILSAGNGNFSESTFVSIQLPAGR